MAVEVEIPEDILLEHLKFLHDDKPLTLMGHEVEVHACCDTNLQVL